MTTLQQRALTGFSFAAVMIAGIFANYYSFLLLFGIITAMSLWEFFGLVLADEPAKSIRKWVYTAFAMILYIKGAWWSMNHYNSNSAPIVTSHLLSHLLLFGIVVLFILELFLKGAKPFEQLGYLFLSFAYITIPYYYLITISIKESHSFYQPVLVFGMLLCVWANDSFAYLVGSRIGKTKLFPRISPGKTWEGSAGGVVGSAIAATLLYLVFPNQFSAIDWLAIAIIASIFGTLGDLVESMLKRSIGVKDSGTLLPGHGGILDRFDAFMFMIIPVSLYFSIFH